MYEYRGVGMGGYYTLEQIEWVCQFKGLKNDEIMQCFSAIGVQVSFNLWSLPYGLTFRKLGVLPRNMRVVIANECSGVLDEVTHFFGLKRGIDNASSKVSRRIRAT